MGLPKLTFTLKKAARTVAARTSQSVVALIIRDSKANGVHAIYQESDIPSTLGADNAAYIKRAMIGHINRPSVVYVSVIAAAAEIATGFSALANYSYDYLCGPVDISAADATALAALVKAQRKLRYIGKAVLPNTAADDEGIINFVSSGIVVGSTTYAAAAYCSRIAGILAGTPADCSATYAVLSEVTAVTATATPDDAVDAGKVFLIDDGRVRKLSRAVTSKTTLSATEPEALKKIKMTAAIDLIRYYAMTAVEDEYLGKCANSYDNKCRLITAGNAYFNELIRTGLLASGYCEIDLVAQRNYLQSQGEAVEDMTDQEIKEGNTGSHVFLRAVISILDAMEDIQLEIYI